METQIVALEMDVPDLDVAPMVLGSDPVQAPGNCAAAFADLENGRPLATSRGIANALMLAAGFWTIVGLAIYIWF